MAVFVHATGEQVVHHPLLDRLILGNQGLGLLDQVVYRRQNPSDLALLRTRRNEHGIASEKVSGDSLLASRS